MQVSQPNRGNCDGKPQKLWFVVMPMKKPLRHYSFRFYLLDHDADYWNDSSGVEIRIGTPAHAPLSQMLHCLLALNAAVQINTGIWYFRNKLSNNFISMRISTASISKDKSLFCGWTDFPKVKGSTDQSEF